MSLLVPATPQQDSVWFHAQLNSVSHWNFSSFKCFKGVVQLPLLRAALTALVEKHASLRTNFLLRDKQVLQSIAGPVQLHKFFLVTSSDETDPAAITKEVEWEIEQLLKYEFNLENEVLFRFKLLQFKDQSYFIVVINHIVADVISMSLFWNDLAACYNALCENREITLNNDTRQYHDYSIEQQKYFETPLFKSKKEFWINKLSDELPTLHWPFYRHDSNNIAVIKEQLLAPELAEEARLFALRNKMLFSAIFQAAYFILLRQYSGQNKIIIGNVTHGRGNKKANNSQVFGLFTNRITHIHSIDPQERAIDFMKRVNTDLITSLQNDDVPFDELIRQLGNKKENGLRPLFQAVFNLVKDTASLGSFTGLTEQFTDVSLPEGQRAELRYDIKLMIVDAIRQVRLRMVINCDDNYRSMAGGVLDSYLEIIACCLRDPYITISAINITATDAIQQLLQDSKAWQEEAAQRQTIAEEEGMGTGAEYVAPRNETEEKLAYLWSDVLSVSVEKISVKDDFFVLGGHSLKVTRLLSQIGRSFMVQLPLKALFNHSVLEQQAVLIGQAQRAAVATITPVAIQEYYPVSSAQRRLWVLSQFEDSNIAYNMPMVYRLEGPIDKTAFDAAFNQLINRHEVLRTIFRQDEQGDVFQHVKSPEHTSFSVTYKDLRHATDAVVHVKELLQEAATAPFDLETGPLIRASLLQVEDNRFVFGYTLHHIVSDAWSMELMIRELATFYNAQLAGQPEVLSPLRIQYKDYAAWQTGQLADDTSRGHKAYWLQQFAGELPVLNLPADKIRPAIKSYTGNAIYGMITREMTTGLKTLVREAGGTLFMGLTGLLNTLFHRYTGQEDIILGSVMAGRHHIDLEDQIGFYLNPVALRTQFSKTDTFKTLLAHIKQITLDAYEHQSYPFDELVDQLQVTRDMSRSPLFDVFLLLQNKNTGNQQQDDRYFGNAQLRPYAGGERVISKYDLAFNFVELDDTIEVGITWNSDIYHKETIERLSGHLQQLLATVIAHPDTPLSQLDYVTMAEKKHLLEVFNQPASHTSEEKTIVDWFEEQVAGTPGNIAIVTETTTLDYTGLNAKANQLAAYLRERYDVKPNDLVGIQTDRSEWAIIAMLGVLKSGAAYIPIDPSTPQARIDYILQDSRAGLLLDDEALLSFIKNAGQYSSSNPPRVNTPADTAYIIYTSGSTGRPKGVIISHSPLVNYFTAMAGEYAFCSDDRVVQVTSISFDAAAEQIWLTLLHGASLYMINKELLPDSAALNAYIITHKITHIHAVPTLLQQVNITEGSLLKRIVSAGDTFSRSILNDLPGGITVYNKYGPTEATISATVFKVPVAGASYTSMPIGHPVAGNRVYIVDEHNMLVPAGIAGEICIAGAGLANGYLNQPALTAEKFVADPFYPGQRMYKTGDLGRWLPDGNIEFLGRNDHQVKIRGYRIELGEIEKVLLNLEGVQAAVVTASPKNREELIAYLVSNIQLQVPDVRQALSRELPGYMIPSYYVRLKKLPLTVNGKIDRKALPLPEAATMPTGVEYIAPRNETEAQLTAIWSEVLVVEKEKISVKDGFFELGGHSLKATRLAAQISRRMAVRIGLKELFSISVLEEQARLIDETKKTTLVNIEPVAIREYYPLSSAQRRLWVLSQFEGGNIAYNVPVARVFEGVLDKTALTAAFRQLLARHESLRTEFRQNEQGEIYQYIRNMEEIEFDIQYQDLRTSANTWQQVKELLQQEVTTPFDLTSGPLLRSVLLQVSDNAYVFSYIIHHIVSDAWSTEVMTRELTALYNAFITGNTNPLPALRIQYKDYAAWQLNGLSGAEGLGHKTYWLQQLGGELPVLELPADYVRPAIRTYNGEFVYSTINATLTEGLKTFVREGGCTLFMGLLGLVNTLFFRYTGQQDIILGTTIAGRDHIDLEDQVGFYVNMLAIRTRFNENDHFSALLQKIKKVTLDAYEHQRYPFDELTDELKLARDMSRSPLFDVAVLLHNEGMGINHQQASSFGEASMKPFKATENVISKFDLSLHFAEVNGCLSISIEYNTAIYKRARIEQLCAHLQQLLAAIIATPSRPIADIDYISLKEKQQLMFGFNQTAVDYPSYETLPGLFCKQANTWPDKVAVIAGEKEVTYQQLHEQSDRLAHYLQQTYALRGDDQVGILLDRSELMVVAILGILKSGAAYVPIPVQAPESRKAKMVASAQCKAIVTHLDYFFEASAWDIPVFCLDIQLDELTGENPAPGLLPDITSGNLAYIMYTSGSTGEPKGVMVEQKSVIRLVKEMNFVTIRETDIFLSLSDFSFDGSVLDIFGALLNGCTLVIPSREVMLNMPLLGKLIKEKNITLFFITTALFNSLVDAGITDLGNLQQVMFGGEQTSLKHTVRFINAYPGIDLINVYGPTENTTFSTYYPVRAISEKTLTVPIGKPISNSQVYILDAGCRLAPVGIPGEIYVGGDGLARGYLNDQELTRLKFIAHPFAAGERLYKTGDVGRWTFDGNIEFLGRIDNQVKIRGYRIEPGEIERILETHGNIDRAVVIALPSPAGERELVAYLMSPETVAIPEIRKTLSKQLPAYMVPAHYIQVPHIPLTVNGKVNQKALPLPEYKGIDTGVEFIAPRNETETQLVAIWSDVLSIEKEKISVKDSFFELGGHSLKATRLSGHISQCFQVQIGLKELFTQVVLEDQALLINATQKTSLVAITPVPLRAYYPLSSAQRRLWVLSRFEGGNVAYNMSMTYLLEGSLHIDALREAFNTLIARHEILRTVFRQHEDGEVYQYIKSAEQASFVIRYEDLRGTNRLKGILQQESSTPFDLATGPLLRTTLLQIEEEKYVLSNVMHHIISDGWSMEVMVRELSTLYNAYLDGRPDPLPALAIQYKDYAAWQLDQLSDTHIAGHQAYWLQQLDGELPVLDLPSDKPRPPVKTYHGRVIYSTINPQMTDALRTLTRSSGSTLFMGLVSLVNTLFYHYTGQEDIILGSPIAGRDHVDLEGQIGFYVNLLSLRNRFSKTDSFTALLKKVKQVTLDAYEHQSYPFDELVNRLHPERDLSRSPLFDVVILLQNTDIGNNHHQAPHFGPTKLNGYKTTERVISKFDLSLTFVEMDGGLSLAIEYNSDIFNAGRIEQLSEHLQQLLQAVVADPGQPIESVNFISDREKHRVLNEFNNTQTDYPEDLTIVDLFEQQANKIPDNIALCYEGTALSYKELNDKADAVANKLLSNASIEPNDKIAFLFEPSAEMVITMIAILKAGCAYVPLSPDVPAERNRFIYTDCKARLLVIQKDLIDRYPSLGAIAESDQLIVVGKSIEAAGNKLIHNRNAVAESLMYVIYTSGTTGVPKGVELGMPGVLNMIHFCKDAFGLKRGLKISQVANICFDAAAFEIWPCLLTGGELHMAANQYRADAGLMGAWLVRHQIEMTYQAPVIAESLLKEEGFIANNNLRIMNVAGDVFNYYPANELAFRLFNLYGPTEDSVWTTWHEVRSDRLVKNYIIGKPIANKRLFVLNKHHKLLPIGVPGELCIAGKGLANGYLNNDALTNEKFVTNPFSDNERIYKTGDLVRWTEKGEIEFLGRIDSQVKIRGYRIEPGEIEKALQSHAGIEAAVVIATDQHPKELVAYIVGKTELHITDIRSTLSSLLPAYMLPTHYIQLKALPLTPNGKINRKALPLPAGISMKTGAVYVTPRNETEAQLLTIWSNVLAIQEEKISVKDDFFDLGGDSFKAVKASYINDVALPANLIYEHRTIEAYARVYPHHLHAGKDLLRRKHYDQGHTLNIILVPPMGAHDLIYEDLGHQLAAVCNVYTVVMPWSSFPYHGTYYDHVWIKEQLLKEVQKKVSGDIMIVGHSSGTSLALLLACELEKYKIPVIGLFQCAAMLTTREIIERRKTTLTTISNDVLWNDFIRISGSKDLEDNKQRNTFLDGLRHDGIVSCDIMLQLLDQNEAAPVLPFIHLIYGGNDPLTIGYQNNADEWSMFSSRVDYDVIANAGHYFVSDFAKELTAIIKSKTLPVFEK